MSGQVAELEALTSIGEQRSEHAVLERLLTVARAMTGACQGLALVLGSDGTPAVLVHQGLGAERMAELRRLAGPVELVGQVLRGRALRLDRMAQPMGDGGSSGDWPPLGAVLGVPIACDGEVLGALLLTRSPDDGVFGATDEQVAAVLTRQAATAVGALRREEGAHELLDALGSPEVRADDPPASSDALADALAPAGGDVDPLAEPKAGHSPVVRRLLRAARTVLGMDLAFLSHLDHGQQMLTHVDAGPHAPAVPEGLSFPVSDGYCALMLSGEVPPAVPDVRAVPAMASLAVSRELGVGAYCGVPVRLPDGALYGTLCGLQGEVVSAPTSGQLQALRTIADLIGARLEQERQQELSRARRRRSFLELADGPRRSLALQPIRELSSGRTVGFEALSRFTDAAGAPRRPDHVFAEAQRLGLGVRLELAAARSALALLELLPAGTYLSVNLSPQVLLHPATADLLAHGPLDRVVIEVTEHAQVADYGPLLDALSPHRARGLRLAVDDAGAGFASLRHITVMSPDVIKVDVAFVRDVDTAPAQRAVVRALVAYAEETGAALVAEGVETDAELQSLQQLGVVLGQGYLLGRPAIPGSVLTAAG